jgi:hypothetical protein
MVNSKNLFYLEIHGMIFNGKALGVKNPQTGQMRNGRDSIHLPNRARLFFG